MILTFAEFELDLSLFELRRAHTSVSVQPKVFRLLQHLALNHERVVPKEELFAVLWPDEAVGQSSLTRAVRCARIALGDKGDSQRLIWTARGFGYRLLAAVEIRVPPKNDALRRFPGPNDPNILSGRRALRLVRAPARDPSFT